MAPDGARDRQGRIRRQEKRSELDAQQSSAAWGIGYESIVSKVVRGLASR